MKVYKVFANRPKYMRQEHIAVVSLNDAEEFLKHLGEDVELESARKKRGDCYSKTEKL